jgi:hypothetical protein
MVLSSCKNVSKLLKPKITSVNPCKCLFQLYSWFIFAMSFYQISNDPLGNLDFIVKNFNYSLNY